MSNTKGSKLLIIGKAGAGKSYSLKKLEDAYVFYADTKKRFPLDMIHTNIFTYKAFVTKKNGKVVNAIPSKAIEYQGMSKFKQSLLEKLKAYKALKGHLPKTVAFDAITNIYKMVGDYIQKTTKNNYGSHSADTARDVDDFLDWIERILISKGINVVFLAHAIVNRETGLLQVATSGSKTFENTGGFFGSFNYASYVYVHDGIRLIAHKDLEYSDVCRSMLDDILETEDATDFNIQGMLDKIREQENKNNDNEL